MERKVSGPAANEPTGHEARQMQRNAETVLRRREDQPRRPVHASDYVHLTHPDSGDAVVFVPGELLPDWAADAVRGGRYSDGDDTIVKLGLPDQAAK